MLPRWGAPGKGCGLRRVTVPGALAWRARPIDNRASVSAWPIEELLFRPVATVLGALAVPAVTRRVLVALVSPNGIDDASRGALSAAFTLMLLVEGILAAGLGYTSLPAALLDGSLARGGAALSSAAIALGSGVLLQRRWLGAARPTASRSGVGAAVVVSIGLASLGVLLERTTRIDDAAIIGTSEDAGWRRLRIDPRDGNAMLAVAWASADDNDLEEARGRIDEAERMGAPAAELGEARAEVSARSGDCAAAWASFDEALRIRADAAFARGELPELGGYHLPPAMVTRCPR
jgi:hypothetical protein